MIPRLTKENFDAVIRSGDNLILFFYKEEDPTSYIAMSSLNELDQLHGKNFEIYIIPIDQEPEIASACSISDIPELITVKQTKIYRRANGILKCNEILNLLK